MVLGVATDVKPRNLTKPARATQLDKEVSALAESIGRDIAESMSFADFDKFIDKQNEYKVVFLSKGPQGVVFTYETEARVQDPKLIHIFWDNEQSALPPNPRCQHVYERPRIQPQMVLEMQQVDPKSPFYTPQVCRHECQVPLLHIAF